MKREVNNEKKKSNKYRIMYGNVNDNIKWMWTVIRKRNK